MAYVAPTPSEYRQKYPKFANASDTMILQALTQALLFVSEEAFLIRYAYAIEIKAACILEAQKYGQTAAPPAKGETMQYASMWAELCGLSPLRGMVL